MDIGYSGLAAELYDLWWAEKTLEDEAFYLRMLEHCVDMQPWQQLILSLRFLSRR